MPEVIHQTRDGLYPRFGLALADRQLVYVREDLPGCVKRFVIRTSGYVFFGPGIKPTFMKRKRKEIYDNVMEKAEKILSGMKQS